MGLLTMSKKERDRLEAVRRVDKGEWTLTVAAKAVRVSYRQMKRVWARYQAEGDAGLIHRTRGRASNRKIDPEVRARVLEAIRQRYADFGPTLAVKQLAKREKIAISVSTLRRWLQAEGLPTGPARRASKHRKRRPRRACFGELVQLDGSPHDWFEGRRDSACLMVMIDDATSRVVARFFERETTLAAMETFRAWVERYGLPAAVYPDRHTIYRPEREPTLAESLAGQEPTTQFGRAMKAFGVELIHARSPQAKGRVERSNRTFQDQLVKELRLEGISTLSAANELLSSGWLDSFSAEYGVTAANAMNVHRKRPSKRELDRHLRVWEERRVNGDLTIRWSNRWFQLLPKSSSVRWTGKRATVIHRESLVSSIEVNGRAVAFQEISVPTPQGESASRSSAGGGRIKGLNRSRVPPANHPWRKSSGDRRRRRKG